MSTNKVKKISIGADHRGYKTKEFIKEKLKEKGYEIIDFGTNSEESMDYPDVAIPVAEAVKNGKTDRGILFCSSGVGMSITANKVKGVKAVLCYSQKIAEYSRLHNNTNVFCSGADYFDKNELLEMIEIWLKTEFEAGRHERRLGKIENYEKNSCQR